ncbi:MAG: hypothetical protein U1C49_01595 [Candidatus Andersenbacteria bacterium]|nr:hypothetical protein [bacterium]MDZ4225521.1 hypothetical protein [Candidatus Andersenbacteria bacterium]
MKQQIQLCFYIYEKIVMVFNHALNDKRLLKKKHDILVVLGGVGSPWRVLAATWRRGTLALADDLTVRDSSGSMFGHNLCAHSGG